MSARSRHITWRLTRALLAGSVKGELGILGRAQLHSALASEFRAAFQDLGPAFIKLGQLISIRPDVFPPQWVFEMERLQDQVPSVPAEEIAEVVRRSLGASPSELFDDWADTPLASASIAQVHRARLKAAYRPVVGPELPAGTELAVKVVKPGVEHCILADVEVARSLVGRVAGLRRLKRYSLPEILEEFASTLVSECDLRNEAAVADRFAFDLRDDEYVVIPEVVWPLTTRQVLTTRFVHGWRLTDLTSAEREGVDAYFLALHGAEVFMRQVLVLGRFHADLHPANLLVTPESRICYLDFGIVGTTEPAQRYAIAQVLAATVYGDADRALRYSADLGLVVPEHKRPAVRAKVRDLMAGTLATPPRDIRAFAIGFLGIMDEAEVHVPVGYGLLIKALVTVEGVAQGIYPDIDITRAAQPYATRLVAAQLARPDMLAERVPEAVRAALRVLTS